MGGSIANSLPRAPLTGPSRVVPVFRIPQAAHAAHADSGGAASQPRVCAQ